MENLVSKKRISELLKEAGVGFVKVTVDSWTDKTYKNFNGKTFKGVKGSSVGPMTSTNAHVKRDQETLLTVSNILPSFYQKSTEGAEDLRYEFPLEGGKQKRIVTFMWQRFPSNAPSRDLDSAYETNWLVVSTKDIKL